MMTTKSDTILAQQVVHELLLAAFNRIGKGDQTHVVANIYANRDGDDAYSFAIGVDEYGPFGFRDGIEWGVNVILQRMAAFWAMQS
jgi:hypothetical protein